MTHSRTVGALLAAAALAALPAPAFAQTEEVAEQANAVAAQAQELQDEANALTETINETDDDTTAAGDRELGDDEDDGFPWGLLGLLGLAGLLGLKRKDDHRDSDRHANTGTRMGTGTGTDRDPRL